MNLVIDRVEDDLAILEWNGARFEVPLGALPEGAREGALLRLVLVEEPERLDRARARLERLRALGPTKDDIEL